MDVLTRLIHLLALAAYLGSTLAIALVFLPAAEDVTDPALQRRLLARGLRPYNVLSIGALGVLVISGASGLTDLKAMLGQNFGRLLWPLLGKLTLTFVLINVATYLSFGLAHRLVRASSDSCRRGGKSRPACPPHAHGGVARLSSPCGRVERVGSCAEAVGWGRRHTGQGVSWNASSFVRRDFHREAAQGRHSRYAESLCEA